MHTASLADIPVPSRVAVPPLAPGVVIRAGLQRALQRIATVPVTLVVGPRGSGKTSLLVAYAHRTPCEVRWLTLERRDAHPSRFWRTLLAGVRGTPAHDPADASTLEHELAGLEELGHDVVVVLDEYQEVSHPDVDRSLAAILRFLPSNVHLVFLSRTTPAVGVHRLRVEGRLLEIGEGDLRLDLETVASVIELVAGARPDRRTLNDIVARTEGWAAGVRLAATRIHAAASATEERVVTDALEELDPTDRAVLVQTAFLDWVTPGLCDAVTGRTDGAAVLQRLATNGLFVVAIGGEEVRVRHRRVFVEPLRALATERYGHELRRVRAAAADWLEAHGEHGAAVDHRQAIGDHAGAWPSIRRHHAEWQLRGQFDDVERRVTALPTAFIDADPGRMVDVAQMLTGVGRIDDADEWLRRAQAASERDGDAHLAARVVLARARSDQACGEVARAAAAMGDAARLLPDAVGEEIRGRRIVELAHARLLANDLDGARDALARIPLLDVSGSVVDEVLATTVRGELALADARLRDARLAADRAIDAAAHVGGGEVLSAIAHFVRGSALLEQGELDDALADLEAAGRGTPPRSHVHRHVLWRVASARARFALGWRSEAFGLLVEARRSPTSGPVPGWLLSQIDEMEGRLHLVAGEPGPAAEAIERLQPGPSRALLSAWLAIVTGRIADAADILHALDPPPGRPAIDRELLRMRVAGDDMEAAVASTRVAAALGWPDRYRLVFAEHAPAVARPLRLLRSTDSTAYLSSVMAAVDARLLRPGAHLVAPVEPLTERELAVIACLRGRLSYQEIAGELEISLNTLKTHLKAIYRKLGVTSRQEAVDQAAELRLTRWTARSA